MFRPPILLCNEVLRHLDFAGQCRAARQLGYDGLEVAPFTLAPDPAGLRTADLARLRAICADEGLVIGGLHWLLSAPDGLSITSDDPAVQARTLEFGRRLIALCAELGGSYLVHGSPNQRRLDAADPAGSRARAAGYFAAMADCADAAGCRYLIEPLSAKIADTFTTIDEAFALVQAVGSPGLGTMLDCYAAASDGASVPLLLDRWLPQGAIAHLHLNDDNAGGPGQGSLDFTAILDRLRAGGYQGALGIEPFEYLPAPLRCAELSLTHIRACLDGMAAAPPA